MKLFCYLLTIMLILSCASINPPPDEVIKDYINVLPPQTLEYCDYLPYDETIQQRGNLVLIKEWADTYYKCSKMHNLLIDILNKQR